MRKHFIDNLRWMIVLLLFPYHTFMIYNTFGESFYIKGADIVITSSIITATWPWIMPLLFTVAGISSAYALKRRSPQQYIRERLHKLLLPLLFGIVLLMPIITYFAERFHNGYRDSYLEQYILFFTKSTDLTGYHGGFTPGHLWFILFLLVISLAALPIMKWYEQSAKKLPLSTLKLPSLLILFILPLICRVVLDISGKSFGEYFAFFMIGYFILSDDRIQNMLEKLSYLLAGVFVAGMAAIIFMFIMEWHVGGILYDLFEAFYAYCGILALLGLSKRHYNVHTKATAYFSVSSFAVYLFHMVWIVITAYYVFQLTQEPALQMLLILLGSIPLTFATDYGCRKFAVTRWMFGLK